MPSYEQEKAEISLKLRNRAANMWLTDGGLFGAVFIGLAIFLIPQLGAATFIVLLVTGQMVASVTFDHFGWLGLTQRPVDLPRLIGMALLIGACVLIRS
jgi:bacterial/archaeal transporter family-2 protein